ncbi:hypothetical protein AAU61_05190 [Desulfocarbo indianensis]|nr:hypothetical protein AAU61_05190 [Desulfocarbo indianensis]
MISSIYQSTATESTTSSSSSTDAYSSAMGLDAFLTMFMAQVTNQNPLDPMDNTEFTAQLATFSSLEQLTKIADSMDAMNDLTSAVEQGNIVNYIGRGVTLAGDVLPIAQGYVGRVGYTLAEAADVLAVITDEDGNTVAQVSLGYQEAGSQYFQWDAKNTADEVVGDGAYQVTLLATDSQGNAVEVSDQTVNSLVTGYQKGSDGENYLLLGDVALPLSEVLAVYYIPSASTTGDGEETESQTYASSSEESTTAASQATGEEESGVLEVLKSVLSVGGLAAALL